MTNLNFVVEWIKAAKRDPIQLFQKRPQRTCPCCGYTGKFISARKGMTRDFRCPSCSSRPRDRFIATILKRKGIELAGKDFLHFAPEKPIFRSLQGSPGYVGGDVIKRRKRTAHVDITDIEFPDESFDILMANHVLEHVPNDADAFKEIYRVLRVGGVAILSVPIVLGQEKTWEPPADMPAEEIERICGWDHVRLYGLDFAEKLKAVGFSEVETISPSEAEMDAYSVMDNDVIFFATK